MNKRFWKKKRYYVSYKGFTLVEVLITVAIIAVIMGVIGTLFVSGATTYNKGSKKAFVQNDTRLGMELIQNEVRYATELEIINTSEVGTDDEYSYIYFQDGKIKILNSINGIDDFTFPGLYKNQEIFSKVDKHLLKIDLSGIIRETEADDEVFTLSTVINLLNIQSNKSEIVDIGETGNVKAIKYYDESLISFVEVESPNEDETPVPGETNYDDYIPGRYFRNQIVRFNGN